MDDLTQIQDDAATAAPPAAAPAWPKMMDPEKAGPILKRLIAAGKEAMKIYVNDGDEIYKYGYEDGPYEDIHKSLYGEGSNAFKAKVNKAAEAVRVLGPHLYSYNPNFMVTTADDADLYDQGRAKVEAKYLNLITRRCDRYGHARRAIDHGIIYGRPVLWTGWNKRKNLVQSVFVNSKDILMDPDACGTEELNWIARRRSSPAWEVLSRYPDARKAVESSQKSKEKATDKGAKVVSDIVDYYEVYLRVGLGRYDEEASGEIDDSPYKYVVTHDGYVMWCGPWEIPFHKWDKWPATWCDLCGVPGKVWPQSPLRAGLGHLRALNWIYNLYLARVKLAFRTTVGIATINGQKVSEDELVKILQGGDFQAIRFEVNGENVKIADFVQQLNFDAKTEDFIAATETIGREWENTTGLSQILYTGQTPTQLRTASDVELKDKASRNTSNDMATVVAKWITAVGENERFAARYLELPEDIGALFGPDAASLWGTQLDSTDPQALLILQTQYQQRAQMAQQAAQAIYQNGAMQIQQQAAQMGQTISPADAMAQAQQQMPPDQALQQGLQQIGPPQYIDFNQWMIQDQVEIESGSMRPRNADNQLDAIASMLNQTVPVIAPLPGGAAIAAALVKSMADLQQLPKEVRDATNQMLAIANTPPPPPPPPDDESAEGESDTAKPPSHQNIKSRQVGNQDRGMR